DPQLDRPHTRVPFPGPIPVAVRDSIRGPFMPLRADLLGHLELHQGFCQDPHRLPKDVHICSGLAKQLLKCDHKVGGHDRNLLAVCFAYTHGTRLWPLLSRGRPHPGIYTTTWYSNSITFGIAPAPGMVPWGYEFNGDVALWEGWLSYTWSLDLPYDWGVLLFPK